MRPVLVMLAKERPDIVRRALTSAAPIIDAALVSVEPGDPLGGQIAAMLDDLGVRHLIVEFERTSGGQARTLLMQHAEEYALSIGATHVLNLDADDEFELEDGFEWPEAMPACAEVVEAYGAMRYAFRRLFGVGLDWRWTYPLHEVPECAAVPIDVAVPTVAGLVYRRHIDGEREPHPVRYAQHAKILRAWLAEHPGDPRMTFYLAQSLRDAGDVPGAIAAYLKRIELGGWVDERYVAALTVARLRSQRGDDWMTVAASFLVAIDIAPDRAEALVGMSAACREQGLHRVGYMFAVRALELAKQGPPPNRLFVELDAYGVRAVDEVAVQAWHGGDRELGARCAQVAYHLAPTDPRIRANLELYAGGEAPTE